MIKIILAEDHTIVRNGIKSILDNEVDMEVVFEAENGKEVVDWLKAGNHADLILTDMNMPVLNGVNMISQLPAQIPAMVLSMLDHENYVIEAFKSGARGYLLKNVNKDELLFAIKQAAGGGKYICTELAFKMLDKLSHQPEPIINISVDLSEREIAVLGLIADGYTNNEIADMLFTSRRTVEGHRQNLIDKTGVKNISALIKFAVQNSIIK